MKNKFIVTPAPQFNFPVSFSLVLLALVILITNLKEVSAKDVPGATQTSYGVSAAGVFQFSVPIVVPPGRNGVQPNLSLGYSSSGGNGIAGVGWGVSGLPSITRCGRTFATNGIRGGVLHDNNDRFCLNGNQLILTSGQYGQGGSEYRTEIEQFAKIEAIGNGSVDLNGGSSPSAWKVWAKDGSIYFYGAPGNSDHSAQFKLPGSQSIHSWQLARMQDRFGNYYEVSYYSDNGRVEKIEYTLHDNIASSGQAVTFNYETRPDKRYRYILGKRIETNERLASITVSNNGAQFRQYHLNYEQGPTSTRSRLTSIEECGLSNTDCLPEIAIDWQDETKGFHNASTSQNKSKTNLIEYYTYTRHLGGGQTAPNSVKEINRGAWVDVNGDGRIDQVVAYTTPGGTEVYQTYLKTSSGWSADDSEWHLPKTLRSYDNSIVNTSTARFTPDVINKGQFADVNGDGYVDIIYAYKLDKARQQYADPSNPVSDMEEVLETWINKGDQGKGWELKNQWKPKDFIYDYVSNGAGYVRVETVRGRLIDLNGDGLVDWVRAYFDYIANGNGNSYTRTWINNGNGWTVNNNYSMPDVFSHYRGVYSIPHGQFVDVNGDGLADWVQSYHASTESAQQNTWINNGSEFVLAGSKFTLPDIIYDNLSGWDDVVPNTRGDFVDVNGDGLRDWVESYETTGGFIGQRVRLNTGDGWGNANADFDAPSFVRVNHRYSAFARGWPLNVQGNYLDLNGDGLIDFVTAFKSSATGFPVTKKAWINQGDHWQEQAANSPYTPTDIYYDYSGRENAKSRFGSFVDINADGAIDWARSRVGETAFSRIHTTARKDQLAAITTTLGVEVKPTFLPLTDNDDLYQRKAISSLTGEVVEPSLASYFFSSPVYVTSLLQTSNASDNGYNTTSFKYRGAQVHREGRGFLGFYQRIVTQLDDRDFVNGGAQHSKIATEYMQEYPLTGLTLRARSWNSDVLLSDVKNSYSSELLETGTTFAHLDSSEIVSYVLNGNPGENKISRTQRTIAYDSYGNIDLETVRVFDGADVLQRKRVTAAEFFGADLTHWHLGQVETLTVTMDDDETDTSGEASISRTVAYDYSNDYKGTLKSITREPNSSDYSIKLTTSYLYDDYGNIEEEKAESHGENIQIRVNKTSYGSSSGTGSRLPTSLENALGHTSTFIYHPQCDVPTSVTDVNGLITTIEYDNLCREVKTTTPNLVETSLSYSFSNFDCGENCSVTPAFKISTQSSGTPLMESFLNKFQQPILSRTSGMEVSDIVEQVTEYDEFGRVSRESQPFFTGDEIHWKSYEYDALDRPVRTLLPYSSYRHDVAEVTYEYLFDNTLGFSQRNMMDEEGRTTKSYADALGKIRKVTNAADKSMIYDYYSDGSLKRTIDAANNQIMLGYDIIGRRISLDDPDLGLSTYRYNSFGELTAQLDAKANAEITESAKMAKAITLQYDLLGRLTQRTVPAIAADVTNSGGTSVWTYDSLSIDGSSITNGAGIGALASVSGPNGYFQALYYDTYGRSSRIDTTIKNHQFSQNFAYDSTTGFLALQSYPKSGVRPDPNNAGQYLDNNFAIELVYQNGYLQKITSTNDQYGSCIEHWRADKYDALGRISEETIGNLVKTTRTFKPGQNVLQRIQSVLQHGQQATVQNLNYVYDGVGNLTSRSDDTDLNNARIEVFEYDDLDRLRKHIKHDLSEVIVNYDDIGNITFKSDVGIYHYAQNNTGPHAVTSITPLAPPPNLNHFLVNWEWDSESELSALPNYQTNQSSPYDGVFKYDQNGSVTEIGNRNIYWTAFDKPYMMTAKNSQGEIKGSQIEYGPGLNRIYKEEATFSALGVKDEVVEKTIYLGKDYEHIEKFLNGDSQGVIHRYTVNTGANSIQIEREDNSHFDQPKYLLGDNLGSIHVVLNALGEVEQRLAFDPWGMRVGSNDSLDVNGITNRGFTGHETDDEVGLINMNARIYDPMLGRFLSADPVLPDFVDMQQYNRYSYVGNNPLRYIDPTGNTGCGIYYGNTCPAPPPRPNPNASGPFSICVGLNIGGLFGGLCNGAPPGATNGIPPSHPIGSIDLDGIIQNADNIAIAAGLVGVDRALYVIGALFDNDGSKDTNSSSLVVLTGSSSEQNPGVNIAIGGGENSQPNSGSPSGGSASDRRRCSGRPCINRDYPRNGVIGFKGGFDSFPEDLSRVIVHYESLSGRNGEAAQLNAMAADIVVTNAMNLYLQNPELVLSSDSIHVEASVNGSKHFRTIVNDAIIAQWYKDPDFFIGRAAAQGATSYIIGSRLKLKGLRKNLLNGTGLGGSFFTIGIFGRALNFYDAGVEDINDIAIGAFANLPIPE